MAVRTALRAGPKPRSRLNPNPGRSAAFPGAFESDPERLAEAWRQRVGTDSSAFDHEPPGDRPQPGRAASLPAPVEGEQAPLPLEGSGQVDLAAIVALVRGNGLQPVAISGATPAELAVARHLEPGRCGFDLPSAGRGSCVRWSARWCVKCASKCPASPCPPLVIDKPLRSGQQVYAKGGDLVVLALVSHGAEVIADGSIHIYARRAARRIAGARGNAQARIFAHHGA